MFFLVYTTSSGERQVEMYDDSEESQGGRGEKVSKGASFCRNYFEVV
jgi:hypothetical protein